MQRLRGWECVTAWCSDNTCSYKQSTLHPAVLMCALGCLQQMLQQLLLQQCYPFSVLRQLGLRIHSQQGFTQRTLLQQNLWQNKPLACLGPLRRLCAHTSRQQGIVAARIAEGTGYHSPLKALAYYSALRRLCQCSGHWRVDTAALIAAGTGLTLPAWKASEAYRTAESTRLTLRHCGGLARA